ncbi:6-aminohexanoate hydrolase [Tolypothrix sp. VBCCA 56010]|uniref:6-aminohexanoate hydrolase n=1 Tax=Tolypothrix sp. VBCCA 56010 TaxID=3137731 RepID=UPI003D7ECABD
MTTEQRLDRVENDLDAVRQLLASAATYAESGARRFDQLSVKVDNLTTAQNRTQVQLDLLGSRVDDLTTAQNRTQVQLDLLGSRVDDLTTAQNRTQVQLDLLGSSIDDLTTAQNRTQTQLDQLSGKLDEFVFHTQRLFTQQATILERVDGRTESLEAIVRRLDRSYEEQKSQFQEFQRTTSAALERIDRVLDYLLRQQRG